MNSFDSEQFGTKLTDTQLQSLERFKCDGDFKCECLYRMVLQLTLMDEAGTLVPCTYKPNLAERSVYMKITPNAAMREFIALYWKATQQDTCDYFFQLAETIKPQRKITAINTCYKALRSYAWKTKVKPIPIAEVIQYLNLRASRRKLKEYLWQLHQQGKIYLHTGQTAGYQRVQVGNRSTTAIVLTSDLARSRSRSCNVDPFLDRSQITP